MMNPAPAENFRQRTNILAWALSLGGGSASLGYLLLATEREHLWGTYLTQVLFVTSIALGALFFVILQHLTHAGWSVVVRRIAERLAVALPGLALLFIPIGVSLLLGGAHLYSWNDLELRQSDSLIRGKSAYLNAPFFVLRTVLYLGTWSVLAVFFWRNSINQDKTGDVAHTIHMERWSGPATLAFALTTCFAAFDWLMSLDPHWFSTIFGIYFFAGTVVAGLSAITVTAILLRYCKVVTAISEEHLHDLGKLLFGFVMFWAYIAFSQYLLIWYANIPEETGWYAVRLQDGWRFVSVFLLIGHFVLPFVGLLSRSAKRSPLALLLWAGWLLVMHWVDLHWLVMPSLLPAGPVAGIFDLFLATAVCGVGLLSVLRIGTGAPLIALRDPRIEESLSFTNH